MSNSSASLSTEAGQSFLENMIEPVFIPMCVYLGLEEKLFRLPVLSRKLNQAFNSSIDRCCSGFVSFESMDKEGSQMADQDESLIEIRSQHRTNVMPYVQYASSIKASICAIELGAKRRKNILLSMRKALVSGKLKMMWLQEACYSQTQPMMITELLAVINKPQVRLRELYLTLSDSNTDRPSGFWGALKDNNTLEQLSIESKGDRHLDENLFPNLPNSLKDLIVVSNKTPPQEKFKVWNNALKNNEYLPYLSRFLVREDSHAPPAVPIHEFAVTLADTIMKQTNRSRPICSWTAVELDGLGELAYLPTIRELVCLTVDTIAQKELRENPEVLLPYLRSLFVYGADTPNDNSSIVSFAANRSIEQFGFIGTAKSSRSSMSDEMMKAMASFSKLKFLTLRNTATSLCLRSDWSNLIPVNSWSRLEYLALAIKDPSEQQLSTLLAASPALRYIRIRIKSNRMTNALLLAMILFYCPRIVRILVPEFTDVIVPESLKVTHGAFTRYPMSAKSAQKLVGISMPNMNASPATFHYICNQLSNAPRLEYASFGPAGVSLFELYITRCLPHLRTLEQLAEMKNNFDYQYDLTKYISMRMTPGFLRPNTFDALYYTDERCYHYATTFTEIITEDFGQDHLYPVFHRSMYDAIYNFLGDEDKASLERWDKDECD